MYSEYLDFIKDIVRKAGDIQLSYFRGDDLGMQTKSNVYDVVTRADKKSEEFIAAAITERFPDHKILGEEGGYRGNDKSDYMWVIDPLDGTTNFSQGLPVFCVSVALTHKGEAIAGAVFAPYLDELFIASKGGGAYMSTGGKELRKIGVSGKTTLDTSVIGTGFPYDKDVNPDNNSDNVAAIVPHVRDLRRMGAAAYDLCCVACGTLDGYWELCVHLWDVCAGNLIVKEAGGTVFDFRQDRGISEIAGNEAIVNQIRKYIK